MRRPRNPMRCPICFRVVGSSKHNVIGWHKWAGKKCLGTGCYGMDLNA
jgi:hypothetical protein